MEINEIKTEHKRQDMECKRCGTCCRKGGPAFHLVDKALIDKGVIQARYLYTIRKNEPAFDNIQGIVRPVSTDIIKIKSRKGSRTCVFFDDHHQSCLIYENRPIECRTLKCWDTAEIEKNYKKDRLTRGDLLSGIRGLWELIEEQDARCEYDQIERLASELKKNGRDQTAARIVEIIEYDTQLRELVIKRGEMDREMLEFIFGRPLKTTINMYGLKIKQEAGKYIVVKTG